jgi:hypothetical protein
MRVLTKLNKFQLKKTVKGKKRVFVKDKGWPEKFSEWIPAENVVKKIMKSVS